MDTNTITWCVVGAVVGAEMLLKAVQTFDAKDGHVDYPRVGVWLAGLHTLVSYAMLVPDLLPFGIKVRMPVVAAVERYKALSSVAHVDDAE